MAKHPLLPTRMRQLARARPGLRRLIWRVEAALMGLLWAGAVLLPPDRASAFGRAIVRRLGPHSRKSAHVRRNLSLALPDCSPERLDALVSEVWGSYGAMLAEFPHFARIAREDRLDIVVQGDVAALREPDRGAVMVAAHMANWQLTALATAKLGRTLTAPYTPDPNPYVDRLIQRFRRPLGCRMFDRDGVARQLVRALDAGELVAMAVDYRVDEGEAIPFFGVPAPTTLTPARLALRHGCELVPVRIERLEGARFRISFFEPVRPDDPAASPREQARQMTRQLNLLFERWIRERPGQWLCAKRRYSRETLRALESTTPVKASDPGATGLPAPGPPAA